MTRYAGRGHGTHCRDIGQNDALHSREEDRVVRYYSVEAVAFDPLHEYVLPSLFWLARVNGLTLQGATGVLWDGRLRRHVGTERVGPWRDADRAAVGYAETYPLAARAADAVRVRGLQRPGRVQPYSGRRSFRCSKFQERVRFVLP